MKEAFFKARSSHFEWGFPHPGLSALAALAEGKESAPASSNILVSLGKFGSKVLFQLIRDNHHKFRRKRVNNGLVQKDKKSISTALLVSLGVLPVE